MESKKIVDYIILYSSDTSHLRSLVLEKLNEGYVFLGGASNGGDWGAYTQTMIKYEE